MAIRTRSHYDGKTDSMGRPVALIGYARVSTPDQKPDLQYDGLRAYAERAGLNQRDLLAEVLAAPLCSGAPVVAAEPSK